MNAAVLDRPSGEDLYQELIAEAKRRSVGVYHLGRKLWPYGTNWKLEQLRIAKAPQEATIKRIRAVIAGESIEPSFDAEVDPPAPIARAHRRELGLAPSQREHEENRLLERQLEIKRQLEDRIDVCRLAHAKRLPGETLHAAAARLEREISSRSQAGGQASMVIA